MTAGAVLSGCATPVVDPWEIERDTDPVVGAVECGSFPYPSAAVGDSISYDQSGVNDLEAYRVCSEANAELVDEHAQNIRQLKVANDALIEAGSAQHQVAEIQREILAEERRHWFWERTAYWVGLIVLGVAAAQ